MAKNIKPEPPISGARKGNLSVHIAAVAICMRSHVGGPLPPPPGQNNNKVKIWNEKLLGHLCFVFRTAGKARVCRTCDDFESAPSGATTMARRHG